MACRRGLNSGAIISVSRRKSATCTRCFHLCQTVAFHIKSVSVAGCYRKGKPEDRFMVDNNQLDVAQVQDDNGALISLFGTFNSRILVQNARDQAPTLS